MDDKPVFRPKGELLSLYENLYFIQTETKTKNKQEVTETKYLNFVSQWMRDINCRTYKHLVFEPCKTVKADEFNLWNGWKASKLPATELKFENSLIYKHFKFMFGEEMFEFEFDKFARIIQTGEKVDVCTILCSEPGSGKDSGLDYLGLNILGSDYYLNEDHIDMLIGGNFNEDISRKVLIVLNESKRVKTDDIIEAIKNAITRETNSIRVKKEKTRFEKNNITWTALTNSHDSFKVERGDRRFTARKVPNTFKGNTNYFGALHDEIKSKRYDRSCYDYFMNRKIKIKSFQNERPMTQYYNDLQERNIPISAQFLINIVQEEIGKQEILKIQATEFYNRYCLYLKDNGYDYKQNITKFGLEMKQYEVIEKVNTKKHRLYVMNINDLETYLIKENYFKPTEENDTAMKSKYVSMEKYNNLESQIKQLKEQINIVNGNFDGIKKKKKNVIVEKVTYKYDSDSDYIGDYFKKNIFEKKKEKKKKYVKYVKAEKCDEVDSDVDTQYDKMTKDDLDDILLEFN
jgi:PHD/YefM family antitoxin component YafN of YafNO toxin-antitoxin module